MINRYLKDIPKLKMSLLPTPLHRLNNLSGFLATDLYCKRDDLTAFAFGGNKMRKLDYLVSDAINSGYDSIVTFGAVQSNWCRMTSTAGAVNGLNVYLILSGEKPPKETANLLLDTLAGADISYVKSTDRDELVKAAGKKIKELEKEGRKPYYMPVGGSVARGSLGYVQAMDEILDFSDRHSVEFSDIVVASGSSGTQAGLIAGQVISGWKGQITGMAVSRSRDEQVRKVFRLVCDTLDLAGYKYSEDYLRSLVHVDDNYLGRGYRFLTEECTEAIKDFICYEGIFLDEVYTGKAAAGLIDYARNKKFAEGNSVLFIHTGGNIQLFE